MLDHSINFVCRITEIDSHQRVTLQSLADGCTLHQKIPYDQVKPYRESLTIPSSPTHTVVSESTPSQSHPDNSHSEASQPNPVPSASAPSHTPTSMASASPTSSRLPDIAVDRTERCQPVKRRKLSLKKKNQPTSTFASCRQPPCEGHVDCTAFAKFLTSITAEHLRKIAFTVRKLPLQRPKTPACHARLVNQDPSWSMLTEESKADNLFQWALNCVASRLQAPALKGMHATHVALLTCALIRAFRRQMDPVELVEQMLPWPSHLLGEPPTQLDRCTEAFLVNSITVQPADMATLHGDRWLNDLV